MRPQLGQEGKAAARAALESPQKRSPLFKLRSIQVISKMLRSKFSIKHEELEKLDAVVSDMLREFAALSGVQQQQDVKVAP